MDEELYEESHEEHESKSSAGDEPMTTPLTTEEERKEDFDYAKTKAMYEAPFSPTDQKKIDDAFARGEKEFEDGCITCKARRGWVCICKKGTQHTAMNCKHEINETTAPPLKEDWEDSFTKHVDELRRDLGTDREGKQQIYLFGYKEQVGNQLFTVPDWGNIKHFIRETLSSQRSDLIEKVKAEIEGEIVRDQDVIVETPEHKVVRELTNMKLSRILDSIQALTTLQEQ